MGCTGVGGMMCGMGAMAWLWVLFGVAVLALAAAGLIWLVRRLTGPTPPATASGSTALDELDRRYARGEIDREDYLERRVLLEDHLERPRPVEDGRRRLR